MLGGNQNNGLDPIGQAARNMLYAARGMSANHPPEGIPVNAPAYGATEPFRRTPTGSGSYPDLNIRTGGRTPGILFGGQPDVFFGPPDPRRDQLGSFGNALGGMNNSVQRAASHMILANLIEQIKRNQAARQREQLQRRLTSIF